MAKRNYSNKRMSKIEPSELTMNFLSPNYGVGVTTGTLYIDLSQCASLLNRRFYRQGINWALAGFKFSTESATTGKLFCNKLPNTWVMSNAWEKGFRAWQRMNNQALEENESVRPRFLDFKIYADETHHQSGYANNLLPTSGVGFSQAAVGEWEASKIVIPNTAATPGVNNFEIFAVGANYAGGAGASGLTAVSLIEGYSNSRALPEVLDPNVPTDMADATGATPENWIAATFNEGTTQDDNVLTDMRDENNIAPYPFFNDGVSPDTMYPGGATNMPFLALHDVAFVTPSTIGGTSRMKGGNFPCGLIRIDYEIEYSGEPGSQSNFLIQLDLVPGNHRGYLCEPMTEM